MSWDHGALKSLTYMVMDRATQRWWRYVVGSVEDPSCDLCASTIAQNAAPSWSGAARSGAVGVGEWKRRREEERRVAGAGKGRVVRWGRKARLNYVHCRTGKGNLQSWRAKLDDTVDPTCRTCGRHVETGRHVALVCPRGEEIGRRWSNWEEMDERKKWAKKVKDGGGEYVVDLVETFFSNLDLT
ncbi:hypothetical protein EV426DRAFT_671790 [Tirmania nivea]|nr:hypothetical protein EV426DRAFT_671790 [Tirmania nivea]